MELDPKYIDVCLRRFRRVTGTDPVQMESGFTLTQLEQRGPDLGPQGQPPREYCYPKGVSGNPNGRPKGSRNLSTIMNGVLNTKIETVKNGMRRICRDAKEGGQARQSL